MNTPVSHGDPSGSRKDSLFIFDIIALTILYFFIYWKCYKKYHNLVCLFFVIFAGMEPKSLSGSQVIIMAVSAGVCAANIYYNQPILGEIARSMHASESEAGIVSVMAQAGYGLGLFFITPLGDKLNRKKLILILQVFNYNNKS